MRNYQGKWRFVIQEYLLVKRKKHPKIRFVQDFHRFHGTDRQTFAKYYRRYCLLGADAAFLPQKRGPKWKSRRTAEAIEVQVLAQRRKGIQPL